MTNEQIETMVKLSKERNGWEILQGEFKTYDGLWGVEVMRNGWYQVAVATSANDAYYIANAPDTILALAERVADLEAQLKKA
jgi:hypothetical protein